MAADLAGSGTAMRANERSMTRPLLKPCPLCGGLAELALMVGTTTWWRVRCAWYECGCTTWAMPGREEALNTWNRRPTDGQA